MSLDPSCEAAYSAVFSDSDATTWCVLGQDGRKVVKKATGTGGLDALTASWKDDEVRGECLFLFARTVASDMCM